MPVRKVPKNYRNVTGISASSKSDGQAMFESTLERDWLTLLQFSSDVDSFEVQPMRITWLDENGKIRSYTPDVLVYHSKRGHKPWLCEVKYSDELRKNWQKFKPKFRAAYRYAKEHGWRFKLIREKHIRTPLLENIKFLLPFTRRVNADEPQILVILDTLGSQRRCSVQELLQVIDADSMIQAQYIPVLWYLIGTRQVGVDLLQKLTMASVIWSLKNE